MAGMGHYLPPPAAFPLMLVGQHCFGAGLTPNGDIPLLVQLVCGHTLEDSNLASQHGLIGSSVTGVLHLIQHNPGLLTVRQMSQSAPMTSRSCLRL